MEHGMGSGKDNYDRGGGGRWEGEMGGGSGRTYGKGRRGRRLQGDDPICCSSVGVSSVT